MRAWLGTAWLDLDRTGLGDAPIDGVDVLFLAKVDGQTSVASLEPGRVGAKLSRTRPGAAVDDRAPDAELPRGCISDIVIELCDDLAAMVTVLLDA